MALVAPILVILLVGGAQVGQIAYNLVSLDSTAREGARAGATAPNAALKSGGATWYSSGTPTHQCNANDFNDTSGTGNPVCIAVLNSTGYLAQSSFTGSPGCPVACVTITVLAPSGLSTVVDPPRAARLMNSSPCNNGNQATVTGSVSGIPSGMSATVTDSSGDTQSGITGAYTLCVAATGTTTSQVVTAQVGTVSCGGYSGATGTFTVAHGGSYPGDVTVTAEASCSTPTPTATPTPTPTPTATPGPTATPTATPVPSPGPSVTCPAEIVPDTYFIVVTVSYPVPIFVPFVGGIFQTAPGVRQISTTVTDAIEPCTLTQGA